MVLLLLVLHHPLGDGRAVLDADAYHDAALGAGGREPEHGALLPRPDAPEELELGPRRGVRGEVDRGCGARGQGDVREEEDGQVGEGLGGGDGVEEGGGGWLGGG